MAEPKPTPSILELVSTVAVSATSGQFVAKEKFVRDTATKPMSRSATSATTSPLGSCRARVKPKTRLARLRSVTTSCGSPRWTVRSSLSSVAKRKLKQPCRRCSPLMEKQKNGEDGVLLNNGYTNLFYIKDFAGVLRCGPRTGTTTAGASLRSPSRTRAGGLAATGRSLAILFLNPRKLRFRLPSLILCPLDPLTLGLLRRIGGQFLYF